MFTNYSSNNRIVKSSLQINYSVERRKDGDTYWYKITRNATKNYRYVDLTVSAAVDVQSVMVMKYTRNTRKCISRTLDKTFESITSDITTQRNNNGSYDVIINVNECDSTHSDTIPADPASLFTQENARDYGEGESGITIVSTSLSNYFLAIDFTVTGDLVGTLINDIELWSNGIKYSSPTSIAYRCYQTSMNGYKVTYNDWRPGRRTGSIKIGDHETEWSLD